MTLQDPSIDFLSEVRVSEIVFILYGFWTLGLFCTAIRWRSVAQLGVVVLAHLLSLGYGELHSLPLFQR